MLERHNGSFAKAGVIIVERQECQVCTDMSAIPEPTLIMKCYFELSVSPLQVIFSIHV